MNKGHPQSFVIINEVKFAEQNESNKYSKESLVNSDDGVECKWRIICL